MEGPSLISDAFLTLPLSCPKFALLYALLKCFNQYNLMVGLTIPPNTSSCLINAYSFPCSKFRQHSKVQAFPKPHSNCTPDFCTVIIFCAHWALIPALSPVVTGWFYILPWGLCLSIIAHTSFPMVCLAFSAMVLFILFCCCLWLSTAILSLFWAEHCIPETLIHCPYIYLRCNIFDAFPCGVWGFNFVMWCVRKFPLHRTGLVCKVILAWICSLKKTLRKQLTLYALPLGVVLLPEKLKRALMFYRYPLNANFHAYQRVCVRAIPSLILSPKFLLRELACFLFSCSVNCWQRGTEVFQYNYGFVFFHFH